MTVLKDISEDLIIFKSNFMIQQHLRKNNTYTANESCKFVFFVCIFVCKFDFSQLKVSLYFYQWMQNFVCIFACKFAFSQLKISLYFYQ